MTRRRKRKVSLKRGLQSRKGSAKVEALYDSREEEERALALATLKLLDTPAEDRFDRISRLAKHVMRASASYISLIDRHRQWFKSTCGMPDVSETPRVGTFCDYAIRRSQPTVVLDATKDPLFCKSPYVVDFPKVRFYTGFPLWVGEQRVGTLCALDFQAREAVTEEQIFLMEQLAQMAESELLSNQQTAPPLDAHYSELTLLKVRVEGLGGLQERPQVTQAMFNCCLDALINCAEAQGGILDQCSNGALLIAFLQQDHRERGALCAFDMIERMEEVNAEFQARGLPRSEVSIVLHSGRAVVASLGVAGLWRPTVLGQIVAETEELSHAAEPSVIMSSAAHVDGLEVCAPVPRAVSGKTCYELRRKSS